jgi:putative transposase
MPRPPRRELAGGIHHVTARGNNRERVFVDRADRLLFLRLLAGVVRDLDWSCLTYCLLDNHFHLLVLTRTPTLAVGMRRLNGEYARRFNLRHRRAGHVWERRYHAVLLERDAHLLEVVRYIALNPVRAGLCDSADEWPWSAHPALAGLAPHGLVAASETLALFADDGGDGRRRYQDFVTSVTRT